MWEDYFKPLIKSAIHLIASVSIIGGIGWFIYHGQDAPLSVWLLFFAVCGLAWIWSNEDPNDPWACFHCHIVKSRRTLYETGKVLCSGCAKTFPEIQAQCFEEEKEFKEEHQGSQERIKTLGALDYFKNKTEEIGSEQEVQSTKKRLVALISTEGKPTQQIKEEAVAAFQKYKRSGPRVESQHQNSLKNQNTPPRQKEEKEGWEVMVRLPKDADEL